MPAHVPADPADVSRDPAFFTPTPMGSLHRNFSYSSQWSATDVPHHHIPGSSYSSSSSVASTHSVRSPLPIRSPSVRSTRLRSTSGSSSHATGLTHRRDPLDEGEEDEENGNDGDEDEDDTGSISRSLARRGKGIAEESGAEDSDDPGGEITVKERQSLINVQHPFGLPIWKPALYKKARSLDRVADQALHLVPSAQAERHLLPGNIFWILAFGWWIALVCVTVSAILYVVPRGGKRYASLVYGLGWYLVWPFGKYVEGDLDSTDAAEEDAADEDVGSVPEQDTIRGSPRPPPSDRSGSVPTIRGVPLTQELTLTPETYNAHYASNVSWSSDIPSDTTHLLSPNGYPSKAYGSRTLVRSISLTSSIGVTKTTGSDLLGKVCFWFAIITIIAPLMLFVCLICWGLVVTIPMAKLNWALLKHLFSHPASIRFCAAPPAIVMSSNQQEASQDIEARTTDADSAQVPQFSVKHTRLSEGQLAPSGSPTSTVLLCTYRAVGLQYYKYTVGGVNILFINLLPIVFFVIFDGMVLLSIVERLEHEGKHVPVFLATIASRGLIFVLSLLSVIPLSYFIGMAVASISAQSSIGMGAVINATFGSIIEIILYAIALTQGKGRLVEGSIIGSLLAGVLLMPGISMASGALRHKEQRFNAKSAGVTSMMLIMAIIGALAPTLFYQIYGNFQLVCRGCPTSPKSPGDAPWTCDSCSYQHPDPATDPFYQSTVKTLMYFCASVLLFSYLIGLWFSLHTHASRIWQNPGPLLNPMEIPRDRPSGYHRIIPSSHPSSTSQCGPPLQLKQTSPAIPIPRDETRPHSTPMGEPLSRQESAQSIGVSLSPASYPHHVSVAQPTAQSPMPQFAPILETVDRTVKATGHVPENMTTDDFARAVAAATVSALRNHQAHPHGKQAHGGHGHHAPSWSRKTSASVLLACTALYAVIAELLVDVVDVILQDSGIDEKFLGVTLFALVPNTTEFMNAISFALNNNIALSMEIGSAYALQVCLLQIPAMVAFSAWYNPGSAGEVAKSFTLTFPRWDVVSLILSMFLMTYTYIEAKSNYHRGSILILSYLVLVSGFYFAPPVDVEVDVGALVANTDTQTFFSLNLRQYLRWYITSLW